ncbi:MAG: thioredoxin family protein [Chloroflexota bacterium]
MAEKTSVVTTERFASGMTYQEYIGQVATNKERFEDFYKNCQLSSDDKAFFSKVAKMPNGAAKVLVLGEAFCPDVLRGMPAVARIAEASGMEMRVFPRDKHLDIMNEFLKHGQFQSIPVMVFYTKDQHELCHWIERPELADKEQAQIEADVKKANPGATEQEIRTKMREHTGPRQLAWQQESIRDWRQMLAKKLGV